MSGVHLTVCVCTRAYALTKEKNRVPSDNEGNAQRGQQMIPKQQTWDFPGRPLVETPRFQCEGVQIPPLVGEVELRSHVLCIAATKLKINLKIIYLKWLSE